jgi:hypothetical protein
MTSEKQEDSRRDEKGRFVKSGNPSTQFKKGESGNPNGRRNAISDIFNELLDASIDDRTLREEIAQRMLEIAKSGNVSYFFQAFDRIFDRAEGKSVERTKNLSDKPIQVFDRCNGNGTISEPKS